MHATGWMYLENSMVISQKTNTLTLFEVMKYSIIDSDNFAQL